MVAGFRWFERFQVEEVFLPDLMLSLRGMSDQRRAYCTGFTWGDRVTFIVTKCDKKHFGLNVGYLVYLV